VASSRENCTFYLFLHVDSILVHAYLHMQCGLLHTMYKMYLILETLTVTTTGITAINMTATAVATTVNGNTLELK